MTNAAREALQRRAGLAAIAEWEKHDGSFSAEEMDEARRSVREQLRRSRTVRRERRWVFVSEAWMIPREMDSKLAELLFSDHIGFSTEPRPAGSGTFRLLDYIRLLRISHSRASGSCRS